MQRRWKVVSLLVVLAFIIGTAYVVTFFRISGKASYQRYDMVYETAKAESGSWFAPTYTRAGTYTETATVATHAQTTQTAQGVPQRLKKDYYVLIQDEAPINVASEIKKEVSILGGYVISENLDKSEERVVYYLEFRVPNTVENEGKIGALFERYNVKSLRLETQDVTSQYNKIVAEIESLEAEKAKLLGFYNLSNDVDDLMMLENRISSINSRLNYLYLQKDYYEKVTDYITYHVTVESKEKPVFEVELGFRETVYKAVIILIGIINGLIALAIIASPFVVLLIIGKKLYDRYPKKSAEEKEESKEM
ncbi:hypothetical protein PAP_08320 [Palaeococcus pacificus DY20341]|uniref:DUF4349 domain-containing protein n=1 Tax=Palaeococcus pacificus DY20341 TaxID=1343739 RepID=A0A075LVL0_9EURY|nr:DUF4349 domain-containing protein [Palaeococcus pacificus]AIF70052.1 hypothetical protein PAP_08320 [Palaeococcus pacificus DY20341]